MAEDINFIRFANFVQEMLEKYGADFFVEDESNQTEDRE